ncbi:MAG: DUF2867 domain-containing protein [Chloroflexota bacterium]|nr:DUF2867 domain-containing protein [Chloroflexota bacterium]
MTYIQSLDAAQPLLQGADHFDEKSIEGDVSLREFLAGFLSYHPKWIGSLYAVRALFVRVLGMKQEGIPMALHLRPDDVSFQPGKRMTIFDVKGGQEGAYWIAGATDSHLTADVIIAAEPLDGTRTRFHVGTVVHYHNWAGPVYFNVIRPFHHIVVNAMTKNGVRRPATG